MHQRVVNKLNGHNYKNTTTTIRDIICFTPLIQTANVIKLDITVKETDIEL